ncbi:hypothetical protein AB0J72_00070 [Dactylosporangium sp. NPDC049742]|uniref:hypothetical protein n=1 Tax=Dactylosporangium sp. NPDC049742 TaxID=3154737 RepID=UPI00344396B5
MEYRSPAQRVAVALRAARILEIYGQDRDVFCAAVEDPGADIVCWDCDPDAVLVWNVVARDDAEQADLAAAIDLLTQPPYNRPVRAGDLLGAPQTGFNALHQLMVTVSSGDDGVESYDSIRGAQRQDKDAAMATQHIAFEMVADRPRPTRPPYLRD